MGYIATPASAGSGKYQLIIHTDYDATLEASCGNTIKKFDVVNGVAMISGLTNGTWIIRADLNGRKRTYNKIITSESECEIVYLYYNRIPSFSYTGSFAVVNDADVSITGVGTPGNWKIRLLTSGTLIFNDLKGQHIDIFVVAAGAGGLNEANSYFGASGGGGGCTNTVKNIRVEIGIAYEITIGAGGQIGVSGGNSSFIGGEKNPISITSNGGTTGRYTQINDHEQYYGGNGSCGGGGPHVRGGKGPSGDGGSDGNSGKDGTQGIWYWGQYNEYQVLSTGYGGDGQGRTTREFEEDSGELYAPGGAGGSINASLCGKRGAGKQGDNSGAGGSGTNPDSLGYSMVGFSGIVIIRNSRGQFGFGAGE